MEPAKNPSAECATPQTATTEAPQGAAFVPTQSRGLPGGRAKTRSSSPQTQTQARCAGRGVSCTLVILINRTGYEIRPVDSQIRTVKGYELRKADGTAYHVARFPHGCECTCPDFIFRRAGLDPDGCKHIKALTTCQMMNN